MADAEVYGWSALRSFHTLSLQQTENGPAHWSDIEKLELWRAFVWHAGQQMHRPKTATAMACVAFDAGSCLKQEEHPSELHICGYA